MLWKICRPYVGAAVVVATCAGVVVAQKGAMLKATPQQIEAKKARFSQIPLDVPFPDPKQFVKAESVTGGGGGFGPAVAWSKLIAASVIEKEVATISAEAPEDIKNPNLYKSKGAAKAQVNHTVLAVMFNVASQYDGTMKWKEKGEGLRDIAVAAAQGAINKDDAGFEAAKKSCDVIAKLTKGDKVDVPAGSGKKPWADEVAEFTAVMKRMESAQRLRLAAWTANQGEFDKNKEAIIHEASVCAALAQVILDKSYPLADNDDYLEFAKTLRDNCSGIVAGINANDFDKVRSLVANNNLACDNCHSAYR